MTNPDPTIEAKKAEALERIVVVPPQGVGGTGDTLVQVEGYDVARFTTWASLATRHTTMEAAKAYAEALRERFLFLEVGPKTLWINSLGEMGRTQRAPDGTFLNDEMCPSLGSPGGGGNKAQAEALFGRELERHEWALLWRMQYLHFLDGGAEVALFEQWEMVFNIVGEAEATFVGPAGGGYGFMAWVNNGHVMVGYEPWHAKDDEVYWRTIDQLVAETGGFNDEMDEAVEDGVLMRQTQLSWHVDRHTAFEIRKLCERIAEGLDTAEVLSKQAASA